MELDDLEGQGQACAAIAAAYQSLDNDAKVRQLLFTLEYTNLTKALAQSATALTMPRCANCCLPSSTLT
jgi:hypothetical protein